MFAEPVPVRLPGVWVIGVELLDETTGSGIESEMGSTNIGLNLIEISLIGVDEQDLGSKYTGRQATAVQSKKPNWIQ